MLSLVFPHSNLRLQVDLQAEARSHRIGQKRAVRVLRLLSRNSIELYIEQRAAAKRDLEKKVIGAGRFDFSSAAASSAALTSPRSAPVLTPTLRRSPGTSRRTDRPCCM